MKRTQTSYAANSRLGIFPDLGAQFRRAVSGASSSATPSSEPTADENEVASPDARSQSQLQFFDSPGRSTGAVIIQQPSSPPSPSNPPVIPADEDNVQAVAEPTLEEEQMQKPASP